MLKFKSSLKAAACMAVAALTAQGCSQDDLADQSALKGNTVIVASFEGANTRTSVNDANQVVWNKDDAFGLFYTSSGKSASEVAQFTCSNADGTKTSASFGGTLNDGVTTSYAVYPYAQDMSLSGSTVTMALPAEFAYTKTSNGPMYASASDINGKLDFKHLAGLLKLTVSKGISTDAKKFVITADKDIAGTFTADLEAADPTLAISPTGSKTITVNLNITDDGTGNVTTFYIPIPVGTYTTLSAKLVGDGGTELYSPKEWKNITVARAGMLTASFGYVKIDAGTEGDITGAITEALPTEAPTTATTTELEITGTLDATSNQAPSIEIPVFQNSNVSLALATVPKTSEEKPLVLKDNSESADESTAAVNTMTVAIPKVENSAEAPSFTITMPKTTVELAATGTDGTTYGKVIAKTATSTLIIKSGVTVNELVVQGGNVRVTGTIVAISKDAALSDTKVYLIKEAGATLPDNTEGFEVIDAVLYDMKMALANGKDFTLTADVDITGANISVEKTSTLDLNGHTVTADNSKDGSGRITVKGNFTLKDSNGEGKIVASKDYTTDCNGGIITIMGESAHMTMESGYIYAVRVDAANKGQYAIVLGDGGDFTMTGGKITAGWYAVSGNGNNKTQNSVIEIKGGELISTADYALYLPQAGKTTISGNTIITGACGGIGVRNGTLEIIENPIITSKGTGKTGEWVDGTGSVGNTVISIGCGNQNTYGPCKLDIKGGTFTAEGNATVIEKQASPNHAIDVSINGGTFSDPTPLAYLLAKANIKIAFNKDYQGPGMGIFYGKNGSEATVEVDLQNHTWNLTNAPLFGSTGTVNQFFHLEKGATVTFKNGKIQAANDAPGKKLIQNYCNLTLDNVNLIATNTGYVVSNNNGSCTINNSTITAGNGNYAFDVYSFNSYTGVTVTVNTGSVINGNVELDGNNNQKSGKLVINGGTFNGNLKVNAEYYNTEVPNIIINGGSFGEYTGWSTYQPKK